MKNRYIFLVLLNMLLLLSCDKEEADGSIVFWYTESASQGMMSVGTTSLRYFINGELVGSSAANVYFVNVPGCNQSGAVVVSKPPGTYTYSVKNQNDFVHWDGPVSIKNDECIPIRLEWNP